MWQQIIIWVVTTVLSALLAPGLGLLWFGSFGPLHHELVPHAVLMRRRAVAHNVPGAGNW